MDAGCWMLDTGCWILDTGCLDAWMPGCLDAWMPGCLDAWILEIWILKTLDAGDAGCWRFQLLVILGAGDACRFIIV